MGCSPTGRWFPIVIYNGQDTWTKARAMRSLIALPEDSPLDAWQPRIQYYLLQVRGYPEEQMPEAASPVSLLFRLEQFEDEQELLELMKQLVETLSGPEHRELRRSFSAWLRLVLLPSRGLDWPELKRTQDLSEVNDMLNERVDDLREKWKEDGMKQGMKKGMQKSMQLTFFPLVEKRFGPDIAEQTRKIITEIESSQHLTAVSLQILECETGDEFLDQLRRHAEESKQLNGDDSQPLTQDED